MVVKDVKKFARFAWDEILNPFLKFVGIIGNHATFDVVLLRIGDVLEELTYAKERFVIIGDQMKEIRSALSSQGSYSNEMVEPDGTQYKMRSHREGGV